MSCRDSLCGNTQFPKQCSCKQHSWEQMSPCTWLKSLRPSLRQPNKACACFPLSRARAALGKHGVNRVWVNFPGRLETGSGDASAGVESSRNMARICLLQLQYFIPRIRIMNIGAQDRNCRKRQPKGELPCGRWRLNRTPSLPMSISRCRVSIRNVRRNPYVHNSADDAC